MAISVSLNFNVHGFLSRQDDHQAILQNYVHQNQPLNSGFLIWLSNLCIYVHIQHQSKKIVYYLFDSHARDREGQLSENGASVLINFQKLEHLMDYLCHTYLDKTGKNEIHYQLQFLMCSCAASRPKQQQVSRKHRSSLQIEKDKEAKRQKLRKESNEDRSARLKNMRSYKQAISCQESLQSHTFRLERKRAEYRAQLSSETPQRQSLRLERARTNFRERLSRETQDRKVLRLAKMRSNFKAQLSHETQERKLLRLAKMRSNFKVQLLCETQQMKLLRLQRAKINFRARLSHETQEEKLIRLGKMKTDFKARRLHESSELRLSRLEKARLVRQTNRLNGSTADSIKRFRDSIKVGPYFVCVICNRMLYRVSVAKCRTEKYPAGIRHISTDVKSYDNTEYICHTCRVKAMKGKVPCQAVSNKMELYAIPMQLKCLRKLESVLV